MDFDTLTTLRRTHPGWRLLAAEHSPLVASFLWATFVAPNVRALSQAELRSRLEDHLFTLRARLGEAAFPRTAAQYLDAWAHDDAGWLRKYYPPGIDEPHFDLTPSAEKALDWLSALEKRALVSTESRLMTVFELLRQILEGIEADPAARLAELERRKAEIEAEMARVSRGEVEVLDDARVKDRFLQLASTARGLLSDFREVDQNFRDLDRDVRVRIATWAAGKGALLEDVFGARDAISDSDQGRSFRAFWDFLMSPTRQDELSERLSAVLSLPAVRSLSPDDRLARIHFDWLAAGEVAQRTVARLSQQLRRFLDDRVWQENRRVMQLVRGVEQHALALRDDPPAGPIIDLDATAPEVDLPMERPLFAPPTRPNLATGRLLAGEDDGDADALFNQTFVDKARLAARVRRALQTRTQVSLEDLLAEEPLQQGLAELLTWLALAADDRRAVIDDTRSTRLAWGDTPETARQATVPVVLFCR